MPISSATISAQAYAAAYLGSMPIEGKAVEAFPADFVTVNGYLGTDGIKPFADACRENDRGAFILVKTSNPSSGELQDLKVEDGRTIYEVMGDQVCQWGGELVGKYGYSDLGAVVGATYPEQGEALRKRLKSVFFLVMEPRARAVKSWWAALTSGAWVAWSTPRAASFAPIKSRIPRILPWLPNGRPNG